MNAAKKWIRYKYIVEDGDKKVEFNKLTEVCDYLKLSMTTVERIMNGLAPKFEVIIKREEIK